MNIITFIDYDFSDLHYLALCKMCLRSINRNIPNSVKLVIISKRKIDNYFPEINADFIIRDYIPGLGVNVGWKLYNLCKQKEPFISIDIDTIVFSNLAYLVDKINDKPWISVPYIAHQKEASGGVQLCSDPEFLSWGKFEQFINDKRSKTFESYLLAKMCESLNYNPFHKDIDYTWNAVAPLIKSYQLDPPAAISVNDLNINIAHFVRGLRPWELQSRNRIKCPMYEDIYEEVCNS